MDRDLVSSYAGLLSLATTSIYFGAHSSLPKPRNADGSRAADDIPDRLSSEDAYLFPIIGSATLVGMYAVVKYLGTEWINWLLGLYFAVAGVGAVWKCAIGLTRWALGDARWMAFEEVSLVLRKNKAVLLELSARTLSLALLPVAIVPSAIYTLWGRSALLTDVLGLAFAHSALGLLKIDSFRTGCILLAGLFVYDVWWVFGTEVMVKVATSLDVPIKLLWPKSLAFTSERGYTMLGLGDVVIPGVFVALALRFDHYRAGAPAHSAFPKPYFRAQLVSYFAGLVTTMLVMHTFGAAQPALLYLSPAGIGAFLTTALLRGELGVAWGWSDEEKDEDAQNHAKSE